MAYLQRETHHSGKFHCSIIRSVSLIVVLLILSAFLIAELHQCHVFCNTLASIFTNNSESIFYAFFKFSSKWLKRYFPFHFLVLQQNSALLMTSQKLLCQWIFMHPSFSNDTFSIHIHFSTFFIVTWKFRILQDILWDGNVNL